MIDHIVLIRWKDGTPRDRIDAVLGQAVMLTGIEGIDSVTCRRTLGTNGRDKGVADVMTVKLVDQAALARFGPHPLHREFGTHMVPLVEDLTIVDVAA